MTVILEGFCTQPYTCPSYLRVTRGFFVAFFVALFVAFALLSLLLSLVLSLLRFCAKATNCRFFCRFAKKKRQKQQFVCNSRVTRGGTGDNTVGYIIISSYNLIIYKKARAHCGLVPLVSKATSIGSVKHNSHSAKMSPTNGEAGDPLAIIYLGA